MTNNSTLDEYQQDIYDILDDQAMHKGYKNTDSYIKSIKDPTEKQILVDHIINNTDATETGDKYLANIMGYTIEDIKASRVKLQQQGGNRRRRTNRRRTNRRKNRKTKRRNTKRRRSHTKKR
jgi:hypothetical protein